VKDDRLCNKELHSSLGHGIAELKCNAIGDESNIFYYLILLFRDVIDKFM